MKRYIALLLALCFSLLCLSACGEDEKEIRAEVKYSVYEKEKTDFISFYLTADPDRHGEWSCSFGEKNTLLLLEQLESTGNGAKYTTLILKAVAEGEDIFGFTLEDGRAFEYLVKVKKDDSGILRIAVTKR